MYQPDLSYSAIVADELGWDGLRYPRYGGPGGLPLNLELLMRELEQHFGATLDWWELPMALFRGRQFADQVEDYWERGPGAVPPAPAANHVLAVYGWACATPWIAPRTSSQHRVRRRRRARRPAGDPTGDDPDHGIETLVVFLGANNALGAVTELRVVWSTPGYDDLAREDAFTVWRPADFIAELAHVVTKVRAIRAPHVIWCTVPHVTIAPIARGVAIHPTTVGYGIIAQELIDIHGARRGHIHQRDGQTPRTGPGRLHPPDPPGHPADPPLPMSPTARARSPGLTKRSTHSAASLLSDRCAATRRCRELDRTDVFRPSARLPCRVHGSRRCGA